MGYTMQQIQKCYNDVIDTYKAMSFKEVPCSSVVNYTINGVYRSTDLKSTVSDNVSVRVKLISKHEKFIGLDYPAYFIDLDVDQLVNLKSANVAHYNRFYCVDDNYYTTNINDVINARAISLKRYLDFWDHHNKNMRLNLTKMPNSLLLYLHKLINSKLGNRTKVFSIRDVYFSYAGVSRKLVIVIKHEDNLATESFWFDPCIKQTV